MNIDLKTKYNIDMTSNFIKQYNKCIKQGKDENKFVVVLEKLANMVVSVSISRRKINFTIN